MILKSSETWEIGNDFRIYDTFLSSGAGFGFIWVKIMPFCLPRWFLYFNALCRPERGHILLYFSPSSWFHGTANMLITLYLLGIPSLKFLNLPFLVVCKLPWGFSMRGDLNLWGYCACSLWAHVKPFLYFWAVIVVSRLMWTTVGPLIMGNL